MVTTQVPVPLQPSPLQPPKVDPVAAAAVSVTDWPELNAAEQVAPQLIPLGALVTVPLPAPVLLTVSVYWVLRMKLAVTLLAAFMVTTQVPVPLQAPLQPLKVDPVPAAAVSVTDWPELKAAEQVAPQLIPLGALVTVPLPAPVLLTVSV